MLISLYESFQFGKYLFNRIADDYGGKYINFTPASKHICLIQLVQWKDSWSIIRTDLGFGIYHNGEAVVQ